MPSGPNRLANLGPAEHDEALVYRLPDELLERVVQATMQSPNVAGHWCSCRALKPHIPTLRCLALVCRRFRRVAVPLLYRRILSAHPISLRRTLGENPSLGRHCRVLLLTLRRSNGPKYLRANELVSWLPRVRCLSILSFFEAYDWESTRVLFENIGASLPSLRHLSLHSVIPRGLPPSMARLVNIPTLESLEIQGLLPSGDSSASDEMPPEQIGTAAFTRLHLTRYGGCFPALLKFLQWPRTLRHFYLGDVGKLYNGRDSVGLDEMGELLASHCESLETIDLGQRRRPEDPDGGQMLDATRFPSLRTLRLSRDSLPDALDFSVADAEQLLAPRLEVFGWNFLRPLREEDLRVPFGVAEERWLLRFAELATERGSPLREMDLVNVSASESLWANTQGYSWERMRGLRDRIREFGIELRYD